MIDEIYTHTFLTGVDTKGGGLLPACKFYSDPIYFVDTYFTDLFYEGLTAVQPDLKRINWLAESWELGEEDGKTFIDVKIREGVRFHNGQTLRPMITGIRTRSCGTPQIARKKDIHGSIKFGGFAHVEYTGATL